MSRFNLPEIAERVAGVLRGAADTLHAEPVQGIVQPASELDPERAIMRETRLVARENKLLEIRQQLIPQHLRRVGALSAQLEMFGGLQTMGKVPEVALIVEGLRLYENVLLGPLGVEVDIVQGIEDATAGTVREFQAMLALHVIDALGGSDQVSLDIVNGRRAPELAREGLNALVGQEISRIAARSATRQAVE